MKKRMSAKTQNYSFKIIPNGEICSVFIKFVCLPPQSDVVAAADSIARAEDPLRILSQPPIVTKVTDPKYSLSGPPTMTRVSK